MTSREYTKRFGPITNYAANSYGAARLVLRAIEHAARAKGGPPTRVEVVAALRGLRYQGIAYSRPVAWDAKGRQHGGGGGDLREHRGG
jgi:branched-chain amino acid transport system substrate-binding protein